MGIRLNRITIFFFLLTGIILSGGVLSLYFLLPIVSDHNRQPPKAIAPSISHNIAHENALPGTSSWKIPQGKASTIQIQAYASATSVLPGRALTFYVSTQVEGTFYSIAIYRLGWYGGRGGRLKFTETHQVGRAQGYYDPFNHLLVNCSSCYVDKKTGLVEANWQPSYKLTIPSDWVTGVYLAKFTDINGKQTYVTFDVRGNAQSLYVAVTPNTTDAAYNDWGGYSLYMSYDPTRKKEAVKVSFDRPYDEGEGSGYVLAFEADAILWLERQGYDLSYISSVDLHQDPEQLSQHRAYLSLGHDEYWSKEMRDGVQSARDQGVGLAFLGADAAYWQIRFESDRAGAQDRTIVCYKVETQYHDLANDPFYGKDNTRVTTLWRDPLLARPENALIGIMYSGYSHKPPGFPWRISPQAKSPLLAGTGLQAGQQYGCDFVGYEWDRIFDNGATPPGLQVLSVSDTINIHKIPDVSNTTYYIAPSGAMVFATGSIFWTGSLDSYRYERNEICRNQSPIVPGMQKLMAHVMDALVVHHH